MTDRRMDRITMATASVPQRALNIKEAISSYCYALSSCRHRLILHTS